MKTLKRIFYVLIAVAIVAVAAGYLLVPASTHVERSAVIDAAPRTVYGLIVDFRRFNKWSPWAQLDPDTEYRFEGADTGSGAKMTWSSDDPRVGSGSQQIIEATPYKHVQVALDFGEMGQATARYRLEPVDAGTRVTWSFDTNHGTNLIDRYMGLMMDEYVGREYEKGLANLKLLAESLPEPVERDVVTEEIAYEVDGTSMTGFIAYDRNAEPGPGVLVVHEWWGHNDYVRRRAKMLAEEGYTALALDMYGEGRLAEHPDTAGKFMNQVMENAELAEKRFRAALNILKAHSTVDPEKIAAIGYCFGGSVVLNMARMGVDLDGVVSFHGGLDPIAGRAEPGDVESKMLVFVGEADPFIPEEQRQAFKEEMSKAGVSYPGVKHSFTNPNADDFGGKFELPLAYDAEADEDSWQKMLAFFERLF